MQHNASKFKAGMPALTTSGMQLGAADDLAGHKLRLLATKGVSTVVREVGESHLEGGP